MNIRTEAPTYALHLKGRYLLAMMYAAIAEKLSSFLSAQPANYAKHSKRPTNPQVIDTCKFTSHSSLQSGLLILYRLFEGMGYFRT